MGSKPSDMSRQSRLLVVVAVSVGLSIPLATSPPAHATLPSPIWSREAVPTPSYATGSLADVSCPTAEFCVAVGRKNDLRRPLVEVSENGRRWRIAKTPNHNGELDAVSCSSATWCMAVGIHLKAGYKPFSLMWNGKRWRRRAMPVPGSPTTAGYASLTSISCAARARCVAVGGIERIAGLFPLIYRWKAGHWVQQRPDLPKHVPKNYDGQLTNVSCERARCAAVERFALASQLWRHGQWRKAPLPGAETVNSFEAVSCSAGACRAIGTYNRKHVQGFVAARLNGRTWRAHRIASTDTAYVAATDLTCIAPKRCVGIGIGDGAPGHDAAVELDLGKHGWSVRSALPRHPAEDPQLEDVACMTRSRCVAVGSDGSDIADDNVHQRPLAEVRRAGKWRNTQLDEPLNGQPLAALDEIACATTKRCFAFGSYHDGGDLPHFVPVVRERTRRGWRTSKISTATGTEPHTDQVTAATCGDASSCVVVGTGFDAGTGQSVSFAEFWNGDSWTSTPLDQPAGGELAALNDVACSNPQACVAVGAETTTSGSQPIAQVWDGHDWTLTELTLPAGTTIDGGWPLGLRSVSCPSAASCTAIGLDRSSDRVHLFTESLAAGAWTTAALPEPNRPISSGIARISCPAADTCLAVAHMGAVINSGRALVEVEHSGVWTLGNRPAVGSEDIHLRDIACTNATSCEAVGDTTKSRSPDRPRPLAAHWDGENWSVDLLRPTKPASLNAMVCPTASECRAVGYTIKPRRGFLVEAT